MLVALLTKCVDLENEIRGLFKIFGIKLPPRLGHGSFDHSVRETIENDPALCHALLPLLDARLVLYHTFRELDNRTRHMAHQDPVCQRLMSTPGVGFVTALTFKAANETGRATWAQTWELDIRARLEKRSFKQLPTYDI